MTIQHITIQVDNPVLAFLGGMFLTMSRNPDVPAETRRIALVNYENIFKMTPEKGRKALEQLDKMWMTDKNGTLEEGRELINHAFDKLINDKRK